MISILCILIILGIFIYAAYERNKSNQEYKNIVDESLKKDSK